MGKIVKYCSSCDEGFAEKFGFCPDCGALLQAFEMNPVTEEIKLQEENNETSFAVSDENFEAVLDEIGAETAVYDDASIAASEPLQAAEPEPPRPEFLASAESIEEIGATAGNEPAGSFYQWDGMDADEPRKPYLPSNYAKEADGGYYITVIEEKNGKQRNLLLLGAALLMTTVAIGSTIYSLFNKDLLVGSIDDVTFNALLIDEVPMVVDEDEQKKDKEKGGGGGGGGKEEKEETSQGDLADQQKNPVRPPDVKVHRADNFELVTPPPSTEGNRKFPKEFNRWGDPNSRFAGLSNGTGSGGGQGSGTGTGQGSGSGTGTGSGSGSGSGGGNGDGNGDGDGDGGNRPPPTIARVTVPLKIISKPQAKYNEAGRTNSVQGSVRLKITLLASGQVGSITPVTRLPHGLTEQAIAAARLIKFEPAKVNGIPVPRTVTIDYSFSIY